MRKIVGTGVGMLLSVIVTAVLGYWNTRGVIAIGDSRIPAWPVGFLGVVSGALTGLGAASDTVRRAIARFTGPESVSKAPQASTGAVSRSRSADPAEPSVPEAVRHLNDCLWHLRVVLADDEAAQDLLDQISVKVNRKTAAFEHSVAASE